VLTFKIFKTTHLDVPLWWKKLVLHVRRWVMFPNTWLQGLMILVRIFFESLNIFQTYAQPYRNAIRLHQSAYRYMMFQVLQVLTEIYSYGMKSPKCIARMLYEICGLRNRVPSGLWMNKLLTRFLLLLSNSGWM
jgi:hypothetical protein